MGSEFTPSRAAARSWPGAALWALAWAAMAALDGRVDLGSLAMVLVLAAALSALWLPPWMSMMACALAVLAFNYCFVPPRGSLAVDLRQHALLLVTLLAVGWIVAWLVGRQRQLITAERRQARRAERLQALGAALRDTDDARACAGQLRDLLADLSGSSVVLLMPGDIAAGRPGGPPDTMLGEPDIDERAGLALCMAHSQAMGPGTGRHEDQPAWYLPLRGRHSSFGAALLRLPELPREAASLAAHAQALCDQMGLAIERAQATAAAAAAREEAQAQRLRNTLLTAISHDYRTPLANVMGAASALHDQGDRLTPVQRQRLAAAIVDEADQLARLTANTLQLARLEAAGQGTHLDWESAEEIVGSVVRRARQRNPQRRLNVRLEPGLPLLRCDAVMLVQMLENLVDNALRHGGDSAAVEVLVRRIGDRVLLAVRDRGLGVPPAWRERIFDVFQRGEPTAADADGAARRGAGVGLAVCRAIARAHGGELRLRPRGHGGSSFEFSLPLVEQPAPAAAQPGPPRP